MLKEFDEFFKERVKKMFCMRCGNAVPDGASFCPVCGEKMERTNQSAVNMQQYPNTYNGMVPPMISTVPVRKKKTWLVILLSSIGGVLILILIGFLIYSNMLRIHRLNNAETFAQNEGNTSLHAQEDEDVQTDDVENDTVGGGQQQESSVNTIVIPGGPVLPDFVSFTNNCAVENKSTEFSNYTKSVYFWNYNQKTVLEYVQLLQDEYHFTLQWKEEDDNTATYVLTYTGKGSVASFEPTWSWADEAGKCNVSIWDCHYGGGESEIHIVFGDGLILADTGARTSRTLTPYKDGSGSAANTGEEQCTSCSGSGDCSTCDGTGRVYRLLAGTTERVEQTCTSCRPSGSGNCPFCGGSGKK